MKAIKQFIAIAIIAAMLLAALVHIAQMGWEAWLTTACQTL